MGFYNVLSFWGLVYIIYIYTSSHLPVVCCGTNNRCLTRPGPSVKTPDLKVSGLRACNRFTNTFNTPPKSNMEPLCMAIKCKKCISIHIYYIYIYKIFWPKIPGIWDPPRFVWKYSTLNAIVERFYDMVLWLSLSDPHQQTFYLTYPGIPSGYLT